MIVYTDGGYGDLISQNNDQHLISVFYTVNHLHSLIMEVDQANI
jgi:hypothetical protein